MTERCEKNAAERVAEALYLRVMEATADEWTGWAFLTAFKREPYVAEAREILAPVVALADHFEPDVAAKIRAAIGVAK